MYVCVKYIFNQKERKKKKRRIEKNFQVRHIYTVYIFLYGCMYVSCTILFVGSLCTATKSSLTKIDRVYSVSCFNT